MEYIISIINDLTDLILDFLLILVSVKLHKQTNNILTKNSGHQDLVLLRGQPRWIKI